MSVLRALREKRGVTQQELADMLNITQGAISQWELGLSYPRTELIPLLAKALNCSIQDLFAYPDTQDDPA